MWIFSRIAWYIQFISWPWWVPFRLLYIVMWVLIYLSPPLGISHLILEQWYILGYETTVVRNVSDSRWISWTASLLISVWTWSLRPFRNLLLCPWSFLSMTCAPFGWSFCFVCYWYCSPRLCMFWCYISLPSPGWIFTTPEIYCVGLVYVPHNF